jgi:chemotaxis protein MotB
MAGRKRKGGHGGEEHENAERWLLTYADMITLLVAFFIMLYAMSVMNVAKFQQLAVSIRSGFGGSMMNGTPTVMKVGGGVGANPSILSNSWMPVPKQSLFPEPSRQNAVSADTRRLDKVYQTLHDYILKHHLDQKMRVTQDERGVIVTVLTDRMLFAEGQANLRPEELAMLAKVGTVMNTVPDNDVRIEGHTDDLPIHTAAFPSNWELSAVRATTVLRYFIGQGVTPSRLAAVGYGAENPLVPNTSDSARARNRRVEIVILRQT